MIIAAESVAGNAAVTSFERRLWMIIIYRQTNDCFGVFEEFCGGFALCNRIFAAHVLHVGVEGFGQPFEIIFVGGGRRGDFCYADQVKTLGLCERLDLRERFDLIFYILCWHL